MSLAAVGIKIHMLQKTSDTQKYFKLSLSSQEKQQYTIQIQACKTAYSYI